MKTKIFAFYAILTLVLTLVGYYSGKALQKSPMMFGTVGFVLGVLVSMMLWQKYGKNMV